MPGAHKPDKEPLGVQIPRRLHYRIRKAAKRRGVDVSVMITELLEDRFGYIPLSEVDKDIIEEATSLASKTHRRTATPFFE